MALPYTTLQTAVIPFVEKEAWDNVYLADFLTARLRKNAKVQAFGEYYDQPIRYQLPTVPGGGWFSGYTTATLAQSETLTKARYTRKDLWEPYLVTFDDQIRSASPQAIISLVRERALAASLRVQTSLNSAIWGSATSGGVEGNAVVGLTDILSTSNPVTWNVGGISVADLSTWAAQVYSYPKLTPQRIREVIRDLMGGPSVEAGKQNPTVIVTTKSIFSMMLQWVADAQRIVATFPGKGAETPNYSFPGMLFEGIPVHWSENCTSGWMAVLNENYYGMVVHPGYDVKVTSPVEVPDSTGDAGKVYWTGAMWCSARHKQGVITNIDTTL